MALKNLPLIISLLFFLWGAECPVGYVVVDDVCYYKTHLDVLQDFVDENKSLRRMEPHNIGYQEWTNNQLTYLYLGDNNIVNLPDSIGLIRSLIKLDLLENQIKAVPEGLCNIYPFYTDFHLYQ